MRNLRRRRRSSGIQRATSGVLLFGAGAATGWLATYLDKRRRHVARDRVAAAGRKTATAVRRNTQYAAGVATGVAHTAAAMRSSDREYDDVTLARKVETEIFRPPDAPKDRVSVNVQHGIVELRGEVARTEDVEWLGAAAQRVKGVKEVHNLLHTPGSPPKHSPPSDPAEVRERADAATRSSA
jgi:osmotically-inducible protein OsmY